MITLVRTSTKSSTLFECPECGARYKIGNIKDQSIRDVKHTWLEIVQCSQCNTKFALSVIATFKAEIYKEGNDGFEKAVHANRKTSFKDLF